MLSILEFKDKNDFSCLDIVVFISFYVPIMGSIFVINVGEEIDFEQFPSRDISHELHIHGFDGFTSLDAAL